MIKILNYLIDFLFPPSAIEFKLREISAADFSKKSPRATESEFPFIHSVFSYKDPLVRELIWQIKYKKNKHSLECAGFALYEELSKWSGKITLVPVPISSSRRKERGYNQCELIISEILKLDTENKFKSDFNLLIRKRNIDKQTFKNRVERIENSKNIFDVTSFDKINESIVIVDDVSTTGSTLKEARGTLISGGYVRVDAWCVAH
jgi:competence protein ComFC